MTIYHTHHIVPRHMGGTDDSSNLIKLTIEEHAEAHRKLYEEHGHWQDKIAYQGLLKMIGRDEILFEIASNIGKSNKGLKRDDDFKRKRREYMLTNNPMNNLESRKKIGEKNKGPRSEEAKAAIKKGMKLSRICCLFCKHETSKSIFSQGRHRCKI